jgi:DNA integrity scanning protein DisA with diadenylate cyclase activity
MLISDVLRTKGHHVVRIHPTDSVELAVRRLAEHRIGALVVEDRWMPILSCRSSDRVDAMLARMTIARVRHLSRTTS